MFWKQPQKFWKYKPVGVPTKYQGTIFQKFDATDTGSNNALPVCLLAQPQYVPYGGGKRPKICQNFEKPTPPNRKTLTPHAPNLVFSQLSPFTSFARTNFFVAFYSNWLKRDFRKIFCFLREFLDEFNRSNFLFPKFVARYFCLSSLPAPLQPSPSSAPTEQLSP